MDQQQLKRGYRLGWIVLALTFLYTGGMFLLAWRTNEPPQPREWIMGAQPFVPASSHYGDGYYTPEIERGRWPEQAEPMPERAPTPVPETPEAPR